MPKRPFLIIISYLPFQCYSRFHIFCDEIASLCDQWSAFLTGPALAFVELTPKILHISYLMNRVYNHFRSQ